MNRMLRIGALAALAMMGGSSVARADYNTSFDVTSCGGSNFSTCASVKLEWDYATQTARVYIMNAPELLPGQADAVFASIGITNLPSAKPLTWTWSATQANGWTPAPPNNLGGDGVLKEVAQLNAPDPSPQLGITNGNSLTFVFQFTGLTQTQMQATGVGIHAISGPNCSTKINFNSSGQITNSPTSYTGCGASTVPEPATIGLVTTGLLGLGGAGFMRRRKKA